MTSPIVITGTDTGIGKTVFAAALTSVLKGSYWKPVQSGLTEETDSDVVRRLGRLQPEDIIAEAWRLNTPASPHLSAQIDGLTIVPDELEPPQTPGPVIIEGAGGLLVPLTRRRLQAEVFARWGYPTVLCARTGLGTINHTLLSLEALRHRCIPVLGLVFIGEEQGDTERTIEEIGGVRSLGRLPWLDPLTPDELRNAFRKHFQTSDFVERIS
jgi:dethiobiotin synthetase